VSPFIRELRLIPQSINAVGVSFRFRVRVRVRVRVRGRVRDRGRVRGSLN
jgi:hypothetical protein